MKLSVIIPVYNELSTLEPAVRAVLAVNEADEILIIDDGSTDGTREALAPYLNRLTYIYQENQERSAARNAGIRVATGTYVAFLDADDAWLPHKLERQMIALAEHPEAVLAYCQATYMDADDNDIPFRGQWLCGRAAHKTIVEDLSRALVTANVVYGGGSMPLVRRSALDRAGWFDEGLCYPEDWDLWARLSHLGPFAYIPQPLVRYRVYGWDKVLRIEATEELLRQHIRVVERAAVGWQGPADERGQLRAAGLTAVHLRAALASMQLGHAAQAQSQLTRAIAIDPELATRARLIQVAADRAKMIETATGSYEQAVAFIDTFFANLPAAARRHSVGGRAAAGHLYMAGAFEQHAAGNRAAVRQLWLQGVAHAPGFLRNMGVLSIGVEAWMGNGFAEALRLTGRRFRKKRDDCQGS